MKARTRARVNEDRLSNLSDCILLHILSFLETVTAVTTSVLSKRWMNLWTSVPSLRFSNWEDDDSFYDGDEYCDKELGEIVTQVLARRQNCKLIKLELYLQAYVKHPILESLFHYVVQHSVQEVHFESCSLYGELAVYYRCLFDCPSLRALKLSNSNLVCVPFPPSIDLIALKPLQLTGSLFSISDWKEELSCPHLETLKFKDFKPPKKTFHIQAANLRELEFDMYYDNDFNYTTQRVEAGFKFMVHAPNLTTFKFGGYPPVVCLIDSPFDHAVIDLDIHCFMTNDSIKRRALYAIKMLNGLHLARTITIPMGTIKVLSRFPALLDEHGSKFRNLKCLKIIRNRKRNIVMPECIMNYFLRSSSDMLKICY